MSLPAEISSAELLRHFSAKSRRRFSRGEKVIREGNQATACYYILKGKLQIRKRMKNQGEIVLATLGKGNFIGEMAMLSEGRRSATTLALTGGELIEIKRADFQKLFRDENPLGPRLALHFALQLSRRAGRILQQFSEQGKSTDMDPIVVRKVLQRIYSVWAI